MRGHRWLVVSALVIAWLAAVAVADTGGSMGGGDWSGGGGGGGGGGGDYSSSNNYSSNNDNDYDYDYSNDNDYSSSRSGGGRFSPGVSLIFLVVVGGIWIFGSILKAKDNYSTAPIYSGGTYDYAAVDVSVLRVALDGRSRKFVQTELTRIAKVADTKTAEGRLTMLREVGLMLRRVRDAWVYGGAVNEPMRSQSGAQSAFAQHVTNARAKFMTETIRNADGTVSAQTAPESIPRSEEGAGLILVSIIVAARTELFTVGNIGNGEDLRNALESASHRSANDLVAIEIVWQPSDDADRLSSIELEAKYPRPALIPITGALVGKVFCSYCGGPYPGELVTCPHCGAPSEGHATATAA